MTRQCMRPDCDRRASACLTYDADTSEVWLQDPGDDDEPAQLVCSLHAGSLTAPLGWTITDRRSSEVLAPEPPPESPPEPVPESSPEQVPESSPEPVADSLEDPDPVPTVSPEPATDTEPSRPKPKKNGLLDRAFEWTGPQHSVLTTETPNETDEEVPPGD